MESSEYGVSLERIQNFHILEVQLNLLSPVPILETALLPLEKGFINEQGNKSL